MQNIRITSALVALSLLVPLSALAIENGASTTQKRPLPKLPIQRIEDRITSTTARIENQKDRLDARLASTTVRVDNLKNKIDNRLASTTNRAENLKERLDARLASTTNRIENRKDKLDARLASTTKRLENRKLNIEAKRKERPEARRAGSVPFFSVAAELLFRRENRVE